MALARRRGRRSRRVDRSTAAAEAPRGDASPHRSARDGGRLMPRWLRYGVVAGIAALTVVLMLSFRFDPRDIRTGTVGKPAAAFTADKLDGTGQLSLSQYAGKIVV